ncbi:MAG: redox-regulated ATPase YchF [Clostridia bacterium]
MKIGVVGLPNVGKSTLFNAITKAGAESANYPFCTIEPNIGVVDVPDERLNVLGKFYNTKKIVPASIEFVDIAGLVEGASKGEGLGNKFLSYIREVDAIVHVVRCFDKESIIHVRGKINPLEDINIINLELVLADLESVSKRLEKGSKLIRVGEKAAAEEVEVLKKLKDGLENGISARNIQLSDKEKEIAKGFFLISMKPVIYIANISDSDVSKCEDEIDYVKIVKNFAANEKCETVTLCAKLEEELISLDDEERAMFKEELGIKKSGLEKLITASYSLLGLMSFLTAGEKEVRAWTIPKGSKAPEAAGKIHTDFEKGFIKAEIVSFDELILAGSYLAAREKGKVRIEGKDYIVKDGDIIVFRFNV